MANKPVQLVLDIGIEIQRDVNGVEMGVLENGIPFLTQTGLAKFSGVSRSVISDISQEWEENHDAGVLTKDRISFLIDYLFKNGYREPKLYIETVKDGSTHYAYPDIVCMAVIEYYAFEASQSDNSVALQNYRKLASFGLQKFIYDALGYKPDDIWKYYHDRVSILNGAAPDGHFVVFHEVGGMIVDLINAALPVNEKTIPDISVGLCWAKHWKDSNFDEKFGARVPFYHNYPSYYPQSKSNPQQANAYPDGALGEFRRWFRHEYLPTKFPRYLLTKANLLGGQAEAKRIGAAFAPKVLT